MTIFSSQGYGARYSRIHKNFEAHHLDYKGSGPRPDHAVPGEIVIVSREIHKTIHTGRYKWKNWGRNTIPVRTISVRGGIVHL